MDTKLRPQKSKSRAQISQSIGSKLKKRSLRRNPENDELRNQIVKYLSILGK
jgi:hypothetical protein